MADTIALTGSELKYAGGAPGRMGTSIGCSPSLSGMPASSTLIAIRSGVIATRPPAWPTQTMVSGSCSMIAARTTSAERPNSVGISSLITSAPSTWSGSRRTASHDGLSCSPSNGSNPVIRILLIREPNGGGFVRPAARTTAWTRTQR